MTKDILVKFKNGYSFTLRFTMDVWERLETEIGLIGEIPDMISKRRDRLRMSSRVAAIMAADEAVTPETIWANMEPRDLRVLNAVIMQAISENLAMETETEDENAVHDVVLEEIEAKKETAG